MISTVAMLQKWKKSHIFNFLNLVANVLAIKTVSFGKLLIRSLPFSESHNQSPLHVFKIKST